MAKRKKKKLDPFRQPVGETLRDSSDQPDREAFMAAIQDQLNFSGCDTIEESRARLDQLLSGKKIDEVVDASGISSQPYFAALDALREIDWENDSPQEIRETAKRALKIDPASCDAYIVLAQLEEEPENEERYLKQAVEAGRSQHAALIETIPKEGPGLWGIHEARPFLRAMYEQGDFHRRHLQMEKCRATFEEVLRLNPGDNQGIRHELVNLFAMDGDWKSVDEILERYRDEPSCSFAFTRALSAFQKATSHPSFRSELERSCNSPAKIRSPLLLKANLQLKAALSTWPWTAVFILDCRCLGIADLPSYRYAHPEESLVYARSAFGVWASDPYAYLWLCNELKRWIKAPLVVAAIRKHLDDFIEILDVIESVDLLELGLRDDEEETEVLADFGELASEFAENLIAAAERRK